VRFNICTNIDNGVGLERDYRILREILEGMGHSVHPVHYKRIDSSIQKVDVNIFLEVLETALFPMAKEQWLIPNPEWWAPWDHANTIRNVNYILCKTKDAVEIFKGLYPEHANRVHYIGFESRDLYDPSVPRERKFLHVFGQSRYKNTPSVCYAFAKFEADEKRLPLTVVGAYPEDIQFARDHKNVTYIQRASEAELKTLMNSHLFHIDPSGYEGWGHYIHEGLSCGAVIATTDHAPMNEIDTPKELLIPYQRTIQELSAQRALVVAHPVWKAVEKMNRLTDAQIAEISTRARAAFLFEREQFRERLKKFIEERI